MSESKIAVSAIASGIHLPVNVTDAFDHLFLLGLASIVEVETGRSVRVYWSARNEGVIDAGPDIEIKKLGEIVHHHAEQHAESKWLTDVEKLAGGSRSPLSPRIGELANRLAFEKLERARHPLIDSLKRDDWLTRRFLGALGRPVDWAVNNQKEIVPDRGASGWEMKTRNRGEEFIQNRLAKLARFVSARSIDKVSEGLLGRFVSDEAGKQALDSRTPTGLRAPGPTDNARAWCALWGISLFPVQPVTGQSDPARQASTTAGILRFHGGRLWFFLPIIETPRTVAKVRVIVRSAQLAQQALLSAQGSSPEAVGQIARDFEWLKEHGTTQLVLFERAKTDNPNAPELYAMPGRIVPTVRFPQLQYRSLRSERTYQDSLRNPRSQSAAAVI